LALRGVVNVLAVAVRVTVPFPVPVAPPVMLSHAALSLAVHVHADAVATDACSVPPAAAAERLLGVTAYEQARAAWVTEIVCPATVKVPVLCDVFEFAATEYETVPLPLPLAPEVTVIQAAFEEAVHAQPPPAVTVPVNAPPAAEIDCVAGVTV
jgi:hypothetical protein